MLCTFCICQLCKELLHTSYWENDKFNPHYDFISHKSDVAMTVAQFVFKVFSHTFEDESQARCFCFPLNGKVPLLSTKLADQSQHLWQTWAVWYSATLCIFGRLWFAVEHYSKSNHLKLQMRTYWQCSIQLQ